jgi:hypothetical protein
LIFLVRPATIVFSTWGTSLSWRERVFLAGIAPRGIVAAAVMTVFALELTAHGSPEAARLVPLMFLVIVGTVTVYGLFSPILARVLGVAAPNPQGMLLIGASQWVRELAAVLQDQGIKVVLADSNWANVAAARHLGLRTFHTNVLTEGALDQIEIELDGVGRLLALTSNDEVNALATIHFADLFDRSQMFQLAPETGERDDRHHGIPLHLRGRFLFRKDATHSQLTRRFRQGAVVKRTRLTEQFDFRAFVDRHGESAIPLFAIRESGGVAVVTVTDPPALKPGQTLISIVDAAA